MAIDGGADLILIFVGDEMAEMFVYGLLFR